MSSNAARLLFASTNKGKLTEVRQVAARLGICIVSIEELHSEGKESPPEVAEDAETYAGNAQLKADAFFAWSGLPSLADDAGIEVDSLGGAPGVRSARYAGEPSDGRRNVQKMLAELQGKANRAARFTSFLFARISPTQSLSCQEFLAGSVASEPRGSGGFGYDSIFIPKGHSKTLAEIKEDPATGLLFKTHRVLALEKLFPELSRALTGDAPRTTR